MQGCTATVWSSALLGTTTWLEPGGASVVSWSISAALQGGMITVRFAPCLGTTTVRTPGAMSAIAVGSGGGCWVEDEPPPHALSPTAARPHTAMATLFSNVKLFLPLTSFSNALGIGATGFEPATARPPAECATR